MPFAKTFRAAIAEITQVMKNPLITLSLILLSAACLAVNSRTSASQDDLHILVMTERSEHSRDSNSENTTVTVSGDMLVYQQTHFGAHSREMGSVEKKFKLSREDKNSLVRVLNQTNLLMTKSISRPLEPQGRVPIFP